MDDQRGAIGFAEKVLELLDEGRYSTTYKYAVLLALIDVCLEGTEKSGAPPTSVTTRQLAEKIVELYWPQTLPFAGTPTVLKQSAVGQAETISAIVEFRQDHAPDQSAPLWQSRLAAREAYAGLVKSVEWKLIEMPLPRLQVMGDSLREFIYIINWDQRITRSVVARYQEGEAGVFDNRVLLLSGVGEYLLQLSGLLRPLIQRRWAAMVADLNSLEESRLEAFLFGSVRISTLKVRAGLWEIQGRRCFYCEDPLSDPSKGQVDHFVPWSRYSDDGLDNFVVADGRCNGWKGSSLAAAQHVLRWAQRFKEAAIDAQFQGLAKETSWDRNTNEIRSVARAIYLRLPEDARLWVRGKEFAAPDAAVIADALAEGARR